MQESIESISTKKLSLFKLIILCLGSILGAGLYVLLGIATNIAGYSIIFSILIDMIIALCIAGCYAECVSLYPISGGGFVFIKKAFGDKALYIGWIIWLSNLAYASLLSASTGLFIAQLFNIDSYFLILLFSIIPLFVFTLLNILGSNQLASAQNPLTIALIASVIIGAIYLIMNPIKDLKFNFLPTGFISLFTASALLFDIYIGFEDMVSISEEVKNPKKVVPKAIIISLIFSGIFYEFAVIALLYSVPLDVISKSEIPLIDAVASNQIIFFIVYIGAIFAMVTSIGVALMAASRNIYALSKYDFIDRKWSVINKKYRTPVKAILLSSIISLIILILGKIDYIASISNVSYLVAVIFIGLTVIRFRRRDKSKYDDDTFRIPFYPYSVYGGIFFCAVLIFFLNPDVIFITIAWFLIGVIIYLFFSSKRRIFGTIFLVSTFFIIINFVYLGIIFLILGILFYLLRIIDRHSVIITLAGIKFFTVIILGFLVYIIANFGLISSNFLGFTLYFREVLLRILILILSITLITIALEVISPKEIINFFVKKIKKEKIIIKIGKGEIIDLSENQIKLIRIVNKFFGIIQITFATFSIILALLIIGDIISIEQTTIGSIILSEAGTEFLFVSILTLFGIILVFSSLGYIFIEK